MTTKVILNGKDIVKAGFHDAFCDLCGKVTIHYRDHGSETVGADCKNHSKWNGKKHVVVHKENSFVIHMGSIGKPPIQNPEEWELRRMNRMDRARERAAEQVLKRMSWVDVSDVAWAYEMFEPDPTENIGGRDPNKKYCSFCNTPVDDINITEEKVPGKVRKNLKWYKDSSGELHCEEKVSVSTTTVRACPNCSLNIRKPINVRRV